MGKNEDIEALAQETKSGTFFSHSQGARALSSTFIEVGARILQTGP